MIGIAMKISLSSLLAISSVSLLLLLICFTAHSSHATDPLFLEPPPPATPSLHRLCSSFRSKNPPHLCLQIPAFSTRRHPPPPFDDDIDPRYGVQKRLIPSGPNPLHN